MKCEKAQQEEVTAAVRNLRLLYVALYYYCIAIFARP